MRGRFAAIVVALALMGCADDAPFVAEEPDGDTDAQREPIDEPDGLLDGVPATCTLLSAEDPDLHTSVIATIDPDVDHGPLILVEADGEVAVATTTYESPGVESRSAAWRVDQGEPVAVNDEAARISSSEVDPMVEDEEATPSNAVAEAEDCSWIAAERSAEDPPEPEPQMAEHLMEIEPDPARAGDTVALHFPEETPRGIAFDLQRQEAQAWTTTHWMTSDADGGEPVTVPEGTEGFAVPDIGIGGPGPDHVELPGDLEPGGYRICTGNAGDDFCAPLEISG